VNDALRTVMESILDWCVDDHSWVFAAESAVADQYGTHPRENVRILTSAAVEAMLQAGLIEVGVPRGGSDFLVDPSPPDVTGQRIYSEWDADPYAAQAVIWMNATSLGHAVHAGAAAVEPLDRAVAWAREAAAARGLTVPTEPASAQSRVEAELRNVRYLPNGPDHAAAYHERLQRGGVDVTPAGFDREGAITRLKDASFIIWRPRSADGKPALEFDIPTRGKVKLRYQG
jgi:hypothetical protein